tara:strand:+ start:35723 stop:36109 length:387 start_codon:yes stop_codon:yes gene_type:complete
MGTVFDSPLMELKNVIEGVFMIKNLLLVVMAVVTFSFAAEAQHGYYPYPRPLPVPHYPVRPYPAYPVYPTYPTYPVYPVAPYVYTCNAIGLANGLVTYGIGNDTITASQRALLVCQSTGQICQITNCR